MTDVAARGARRRAGEGVVRRRPRRPPSDRARPARWPRGRARALRARRPSAPTSTVFRNAALAELKPEQLPVAEQLLKGGVPSVRQAIQEQNARARAEGAPR